MTISIQSACMSGMIQTLRALSGILDKAAAHAAARKIDPSVLLQSRLAPDMFTLTRQVQIACDFLTRTSARLSGSDMPKMPDTETSFDELKARIEKAIAFAQGLDAKLFADVATKDITFPVGPMTRTMKGEAYVLRFALPNFYFHASMAYAILRENGIEIGKGDFLAGAFEA
ncbi:MAG: DUF1993 domain-containing protein [Bosea sp. (in: a-proteobacteria)]